MQDLKKQLDPISFQGMKAIGATALLGPIYQALGFDGEMIWSNFKNRENDRNLEQFSKLGQIVSSQVEISY